MLEDQIEEIAVSLFAYAEWVYRWGIQREYECQMERKRRLEERIRKEREDAERKERARIEKGGGGAARQTGIGCRDLAQSVGNPSLRGSADR
ncbi:MAG: hypothetical protein ACREVE_18050 [Gammaproteobacteria bacterium]